ncbi:basal layer antifungal peptide precursor [Zea mays]|nr:basal layer antifungal peptide precursor [Zea mays]|eukprot:NP_001105141.2 basal layer antifungal peptide precursor [Zea mays]
MVKSLDHITIRGLFLLFMFLVASFVGHAQIIRGETKENKDTNSMTMTTTRLGSYVISMDEKSSLCFLDPRTLWYICKITYRLFRTLKDCLEFCHSI